MSIVPENVTAHVQEAMNFIDFIDLEQAAINLDYKSALKRALRIGDRLNAERPKAKHGTWKKTIEGSKHVSYDQAARYMKLAEFFERAKLIELGSVHKALEFIRSEKPKVATLPHLPEAKKDKEEGQEEAQDKTPDPGENDAVDAPPDEAEGDQEDQGDDSAVTMTEAQELAEHIAAEDEKSTQVESPTKKDIPETPWYIDVIKAIKANKDDENGMRAIADLVDAVTPADAEVIKEQLGKLTRPELEEIAAEVITLCPNTRRTLKPQSTKSGFTTDFEAFWATYPVLRKTGKKKAFESWKRAIKEADPLFIIEAAEEYSRSKRGQGKFCKMPVTWLNGGCWDDDREAWKRSSDSDYDQDEVSDDIFAGTMYENFKRV